MIDNGQANKVIALFGPTGVGKTALALDLAEKCGEIISVDSMQIYRYMDIGTAKPDQSELKRVKHHLIDVITPDKKFSAGDFVRQTDKIIQQILDTEKIPFMVGGTGLYFTSLIRGMVDIPKVDHQTRSLIENKLSEIGQERMYAVLQRLDPQYAGQIHRNDRQRTARALEVILFTKKKFSYYQAQENKKSGYDYIIIGINTDRKELYDIINRRVDKMLDAGLIEEVKSLLNMGYSKDSPGMRAIGYKEIIEYLDRHISLETAIENIKRNSRRYAKRQLTWFRKMTNVHWFDRDRQDDIKDFILKSLP